MGISTIQSYQGSKIFEAFGIDKDVIDRYFTGTVSRIGGITLDDIAKQAMVSKSTALNLFRKYLHITPVNYLINYRLKQAGQLLSKTEKKVSLISSETGFHNVDYFCRLFKKRYKLTPTEYRKQKHFL